MRKRTRGGTANPAIRGVRIVFNLRSAVLLCQRKFSEISPENEKHCTIRVEFAAETQRDRGKARDQPPRNPEEPVPQKADGTKSFSIRPTQNRQWVQLVQPKPLFWPERCPTGM